ncbi:MAG: LCP family protein [Anaerolineales bacterium]|jgi:LCP family protein required for cell wall assembly
MIKKKFNLIQKLKAFTSPSIFQMVLMGVGLVLSILLYIFLTGFVSCWRLTSLPGVAPSTCSINTTLPVTTKAGGTPGAKTTTPSISAPEVQLPPAWDGASRVTVMIVGLDYGDWSVDREGPSRSDTMILLTIDPVSKTAGMLSIPRDMWVNIPGFGYSKINNAYALGEMYKLPGGGPGLALETVEDFLGIPIQYYAQVDFTAFEKMIDDIGGICLDVPVKVNVGVLDENGTTKVKAGHQCLSGKVALGYARARDVGQGVQGGDVERAQNQQRVILAIRDKVLSNLPALVTQSGALYNELSSGVHTNLSLDDILRLGMLAKDIPLNSIQQGVIDYTMMTDAKYDQNGQTIDVLRPFPDKIRELVDKIFSSDAMEPVASGDPTQLMQQETASVLVINGSGINGIGQKTFDYLKAQGMNVKGPGNTSAYPDKYYSPPLPNRTMLIVHAGKPYAMKYLIALMKFDSANQLVIDFDPTAPADLTLAVGADWANSAAMK